MRYSFRGRVRSAARRALHSPKSIALLAAVLGATVVAAVGLAGVWSQTVLTDSNVRLRVVATSAGNFDSGWHTHPGLAVVQVLKGSLDITQSNGCKTKTVSAGDTYVEVPFSPVRAVGVGEIAWTTSFVISNDQPVTTLLTTNPCP